MSRKLIDRTNFLNPENLSNTILSNTINRNIYITTKEHEIINDKINEFIYKALSDLAEQEDKYIKNKVYKIWHPFFYPILKYFLIIEKSCDEISCTDNIATIKRGIRLVCKYKSLSWLFLKSR